MLKNERPTIGILAGWSDLEGAIPDHYRASVLQGIQSAARVRGCHLLLSWGIGRDAAATNVFPAWPELSVSSDFVPVGPWNTDGLIVFAPLRDDQRSIYLQRLLAAEFPVLFVATGENGPTVAVNNQEGIHQAVEHLVGHRHRHIAFIAGAPDDLGDSAQRLQAFRSAVSEFRLDSDPRLLATGWHNVPGGEQAMRQIIESGVKFTAVVASNDNCAIGAMRAIREAGLRIPADVAIIGFDDQPEVMAQLPPLASVHVPLRAIGEQALVAMTDHLTRGGPLESVPIRTRFIPRRSCGCMPEGVLSSADSLSRLATAPLRNSEARAPRATRLKRLVVNEMVAVLPAETRLPDEERTRRLCTALVNAFYKSIQKDDPVPFRNALMEFLQEMEAVDGNMDPWQEIITVLRREINRLLTKKQLAASGRLTEDLLHQARAAISESAQRQDRRHQHHREALSLQLSVLTARLNATLDEREAIRMLDAHLTDVGIRHGRVAFLEPEGEDLVAWSRVLDPVSPSGDRRFRSREFPPPGLYPPEALLNLVLLPLVFQNKAMGYVAFDGENLESCASLARQLASTFNAARLHAQVVELSLTDALTGLHNRRYFDLFLKNEVDRSQRFGRGLAVIFADIDHFKKFNDSFGHPSGDKALQAVARCLLDGRRNADVVARIGGEEFALILPETEADGALRVAGKISACMAGISSLSSPLTLSMGISVLHGNGMTPESLVQQADRALYEAKRTGRNRFCLFEDRHLETPEPEF